MQKAPELPSLKKSRSYQIRVPLTAIVLVGTWTYVALTPPWISESDPIDWFTDAAAWIIYLGGAALRIWATLWIAGRKKQELVDDGPYRMCRNPLYVGTFAMGVGLALFLKDPVFAAGLVFVFGLYFFYVVPAEEHYMRSRFPAAHDDYRARVPSWIPRPRLLKRDEVFRSGGDRGALYRECLRMVFWMMLPVLAEITSHLRGTPWWRFSSHGP